MKVTTLPLLFVGLLAGCAGDNHVTTQSGMESTRHAERGTAASEINRPSSTPGRIAPGRVYLITRLETADQPRGEWRAQGETIRERGSDIEFVELGSGKTVSFTAPHQITPMDSRADAQSVQPQPEGPASLESRAPYP